LTCQRVKKHWLRSSLRVTGGSPVTTGLFYDVSYDRTIFDPTNTMCSGNGGQHDGV
jgi:hypothetical protein